jgi:uncharacterized protein YegP (UPF0339 family)
MKCQIRPAAGGQYYVRVVARNGEVLAHSETYTTKQSATNCARLLAGPGTVEDLT